MTKSFRSAVIKAGEFLSTAWLIIGLSLALVLLMESCLRAKHAIGEKMSTPATPPPELRDPESTAEWYDEFTREYDATRPQRWKSYVYWGRRPNFRGRYVNIDSAGHRVTPQRTTPVVPAAQVFFFGGSTMWGTGQRDDHTIASEAARRLQTLVGPGSRIEVTNFGESGYVSTQELLELMLALRTGQRPDVVVFYDGINDVGTTVQAGVPGLPQNESKRVAEFALGRAIDRTGFERGLARDARALARLTGQAVQQLAITEWAQSLKRPAPSSFIAVEPAAQSTARIYVENMRMVEALAKQYGFVSIYVWQPTVHATDKVATPYEQRLLKRIAADSFHHRQQQIHQVIPGILDSAMRGVAAERFVNASAVFAGDSLPVYVDWLGHNTRAPFPASSMRSGRSSSAPWSRHSRGVAARAAAGVVANE